MNGVGCSRGGGAAAGLGRGARQQGAALITSMVILLILTIIGIAALGTTSLEQKMAVNVQEAHRAFEAAESGLTRALGSASAFKPYETLTSAFTFGPNAEGGEATVVTTFQGWTDPPRQTRLQAFSTELVAAHFDSRSEGTANLGAKAVTHQGSFHITVPMTE